MVELGLVREVGKVGGNCTNYDAIIL